jgi:hypothetical protein
MIFELPFAEAKYTPGSTGKLGFGVIRANGGFDALMANGAGPAITSIT